MTAEAVAKQLQVDPPKGLSSAEAQQRLQKYGPNQLSGNKKESGPQAFLRQYPGFMQAELLNKTEADKTPLQKQLDRLTVSIAGLAGIAFVLMIIMGVSKGQPFDAIFISPQA